MFHRKLKSVFLGLIAGLILLGVYFAVLSLVSGWSFAQNQFVQFWYFIIGLAFGFGVQIGLYAHLKSLVQNMHGGGPEKSPDGDHVASRTLGVTGTTSTAAMISCCSHYLTNLLPILGVAGVVTFVSQYQVELFWVGLLFNLGGIIYIANRVIKFSAKRTSAAEETKQ